MRKITTMVAIAAALLFAVPAQAQFSWGIKGGVNLGGNDLTKIASKEGALDMSNYSGFFIGPKAEVRIPIIGLGVEAAAMYAQKGMALTNSETFKQNSFQIPLNLKYSIGLGNIANVFVAAGPEFGFNVGETSMVVNNIKENGSGEILAYEVAKSSLSINIGLGATLLKHVQVAINYNMPWGTPGNFITIDASEIENAEDIKNGENVTIDNVKTLAGTADKAMTIYNNIKSGTVQISFAYLF